MKWFRFWHEFMDDPKIAMMSDSDQLVWVKCLCLASESSDRGAILLTEEEICWKLRITGEVWRHAVDKFRAKGMIEHFEGGYLICNWNKRQFQSDDITKRTSKSKAKAKASKSLNKGSRERSQGVPSNDIATSSDTDTDPDTETENTQECESEIFETQEIKKSVKTSTLNEPVQETNQLLLELKNKNLSEPPENQDPPIAAAPPRDPMGDRFKTGKSLKYPVKLIGSSYEKWHTGESLLSWDESLVTVAIAQLKKHNKPCARFDAINSLNNICHQEDWAKLELLISAIAVAKPISTFVDSTQVSDRAGIDHTKIPKETMEKLRKQREELNAKWKTV